MLENGIRDKVAKLSSAVENGRNYLEVEGCRHEGYDSMVNLKQLLLDNEGDLERIRSVDRLREAAVAVQELVSVTKELMRETEDVVEMEEERNKLLLRIKSMEMSLREMDFNAKNMVKFDIEQYLTEKTMSN